VARAKPAVRRTKESRLRGRASATEQPGLRVEGPKGMAFGWCQCVRVRVWMCGHGMAMGPGHGEAVLLRRAEAEHGSAAARPKGLVLGLVGRCTIACSEPWEAKAAARPTADRKEQGEAHAAMEHGRWRAPAQTWVGLVLGPLTEGSLTANMLVSSRGWRAGCDGSLPGGVKKKGGGAVTRRCRRTDAVLCRTAALLSSIGRRRGVEAPMVRWRRLPLSPSFLPCSPPP
jgi:hypothetical protein